MNILDNAGHDPAQQPPASPAALPVSGEIEKARVGLQLLSQELPPIWHGQPALKAAIAALRSHPQALASGEVPTVANLAGAVLALINPLHGTLDEQTYDEKRRGPEPQFDDEYSVTVTNKHEHDLTQAVLLLEKIASLFPSQPASGEGKLREALEPFPRTAPTAIAMHEALTASNIEYAGYSFNGINLFGDRKSIDAAMSAFQSHAQIEDLKTNIRHCRDECGKLQAKIAIACEEPPPAPGRTASIMKMVEMAEALEGARRAIDTLFAERISADKSGEFMPSEHPAWSALVAIGEVLK